jgi:hypothetical protein
MLILSLLKRAHAAFEVGDVVTGRQAVDHALRRLETAKAEQDLVLDEAARTPETAGTALDLGA